MAVIAFSGATHDIACDGVYMAELSPADQAKYIGVQGAFYNIAKLVANGGLVAMAGMLAQSFGAMEGRSMQENMSAYKEAWMIIFIVIAVLLLLLGGYHSRMLPCTQKRQDAKRSGAEVMRELWAVIRNFFTKRHIFYYICFIILYRFAEGLVMKIAPLFLRSSREVGGLGLSLTEIGTLNGVFGSAAFVLGSLLAGIYVSKRGLKKTLFSLCIVFNFPFVAYTLLAIYQPGEPLSDRCGHRGGVFRLRLRLRGADVVHDAADCSRQASDVTLRLCFRHHEFGSDASGDDEWFL